jgi:hypothetical protein
MSEPKIGFEVDGRFYPLVSFQDWKHKEILAVEQVTGKNPTQLLVGQAWGPMVDLGFATVAYWRGWPQLDLDFVVKFMGDLTPSQIVGVGFDQPGADDAGPPDEDGSEPSETTDPSSESTSEPSAPKPSGTRRSRTASTSGRQTASES